MPQVGRIMTGGKLSCNICVVLKYEVQIDAARQSRRSVWLYQETCWAPISLCQAGHLPPEHTVYSIEAVRTICPRHTPDGAPSWMHKCILKCSLHFPPIHTHGCGTKCRMHLNTARPAVHLNTKVDKLPVDGRRTRWDRRHSTLCFPFPFNLF